MSHLYITSLWLRSLGSPSHGDACKSACISQLIAPKRVNACVNAIGAGIINDMDATISSIILASSLPMAILIVGVGSADFSAMDVLVRATQMLYRQTPTHPDKRLARPDWY